MKLTGRQTVLLIVLTVAIAAFVALAVSSKRSSIGLSASAVLAGAPQAKNAGASASGATSPQTAPLLPRMPEINAAVPYQTMLPEALINANKVRIELELANAELSLDNKVDFDIHLSFKSVASRCINLLNFPPRSQPNEIEFMRLVDYGTVMNTEQARISYKYISGFYESVCEALGPVTVRKLSAMLTRTKTQRVGNGNIELPDMAVLVKTVIESSSISEVNNAFQSIAVLLLVKPASYSLLWQQPFMRAGAAMPSRADRVNSSTMELIGTVFYCKSRPDECVSGTYFTVMSCQPHYVCAPGLDVYAYLAMRYSQDRLLAANQMADALIEGRRVQSAVRR